MVGAATRVASGILSSRLESPMGFGCNSGLTTGLGFFHNRGTSEEIRRPVIGEEWQS